MQPARRGRGGRGGRGGLLLQLAHPEGAPAPGDAACGPVAHSDPVSMGSESEEAMLRARQGPLVPTRGPVWTQTRAPKASTVPETLSSRQEPISSQNF